MNLISKATIGSPALLLQSVTMEGFLVALQIQNVTPDIVNKRGNISLWNSDPNANDSVSLSFAMHFTGNETLNQANDMIKARAKQILQDSIALL
jgi:hypothetical protein